MSPTFSFSKQPHWHVIDPNGVPHFTSGNNTDIERVFLRMRKRGVYVRKVRCFNGECAELENIELEYSRGHGNKGFRTANTYNFLEPNEQDLGLMQKAEEIADDKEIGITDAPPQPSEQDLEFLRRFEELNEKEK